MTSDITKLGQFPKTIRHCEVVEIPAGTTPKYISVKLKGPDGAVVDAWWDGHPSLAVGYFVKVTRNPDTPQYEVTGASGATASIPAEHEDWPFENILTVSPTDTSADYSTIAAAYAAADAGDVVLIDPGTYAETLTIAKALTLAAWQGSVTISTTLTITAAATIIGLNVTHTATDARGYVCSADAYLIDCTTTVSGSSTARAIEVTAGNVKVSGGSTSASGVGTNFDILVSGGSCALSNEPTLQGANYSGNVVGYFLNSVGGVFGIGLTASRALTTSTGKVLTSSAVTDTELGYVSGVTSAIQTQLDGKINESLLDAKGDLITATTDNTPAILTVGADDYDVVADSSTSTGLVWIPKYGFQGQTTNYIIQTSVATNDLTVALKTMAGTDATSTDRIIARIGDTSYNIIAALSVTALDDTNWCALGTATTATLENDLFVYLIAETGASAGVKIGFSRIAYARQMGDFTNTTTSQFYIKGSWTNFNTTDKVECIGRFNAILSAAGTGHLWSLPGTSIIINRPIFETRRLSFTSAITSQTGTITTVGTVTSSYLVQGRYFYIWQSIGITTNGTGATAILSTIPLTPGGILTVMPGREVLVTGKMLQGYVQATTTATWVNYDNTYPATSGANLACGGVAIPL